MNIENYINQLSRSLEARRYSENTVRSYSDQIIKFLKYFEKVANKPSEISAKHIEVYLSKLNNYSYHKAALCAIKYFYAEVGRQPRKLDHVKFPRKQTHLPVVYSQKEMQLLFDACKNTKHKVILSLLYATGLRISELLNLKFSDIDRSRMVINIVQGKGNKDRQVMLPESLLKLLEKYYIEYRPKVYVLNGQFSEQYSETSVNAVLKQLAEKSGIKKRIYPHLMRHTSFTHMVEAGTDINLIQRIAGHKSVKTTGIYLHISHNRISSIQSPISNINL